MNKLTRYLVDRVEQLCLPANIVRLGEPFFGAMGRRRAQSFKPATMQKILLVMPDRMGDLILGSSFIREVRASKPDAFISLIVEKSLVNLVEHCPYVDEILAYDTRGWQIYWRSRYCLNSLLFSIRHLWHRRFDLAILPHWGTDHYYCGALVYFSGAQWRVGFSEFVTQEKIELNANYDLLYNRILVDKTSRHEVLNNLNLLRFAGIESFNDSLEVWLTEEEKRAAAVKLHLKAGEKSNFIAICPTASHLRKAWPPERFVQLMEWMLESLDCRIVLVGGRCDAIKQSGLLSRYSSRIVDLSEKTSIREAAAILGQCALYVGLDTGPLHLAAAGGTAVVSISCHPKTANKTNAMSVKRFGPWGVPHRVIEPEVGLDECATHEDGCQRRDESHCIAQISVEQVQTTIKELLDELPAGHLHLQEAGITGE